MTKILLCLPCQGQSSVANIYHSGQRVSMAWHSNDRIGSAFHQNSNHLSVSKNTRIVLSVRVLGGMIPQRVVDTDASLQSSFRLRFRFTNCTADPNPVMCFIEWFRVRFYARQPRSETFTQVFSKDPLAAIQILCFQSLASLNAHTWKSWKYTERTFLWLLTPHLPRTPSLHSLNISGTEKWEQSSKLKVQSAVNYCEIFLHVRVHSQVQFSSPSWFVTSGKASGKIIYEISRTSQLFTLDRKIKPSAKKVPSQSIFYSFGRDASMS